MTRRLPRILIAAPGTGGGKTTVATGLGAALTATGLEVAPFKVGPDFIDTSYHTAAAGRPGRNLDAVLCGEELIVPLLLHGADEPRPADIAVIEGVMGLFDGQLGTGGKGSSAHIAALTATPVVLVIDCPHAARTHAAVAAGLAAFDPDVRIAGAILNRCASQRHAEEIGSELSKAGIPVLGALPRGLDVDPQDPAALGALIREYVDLGAILAVAEMAPEIDAQPWRPDEHVTAGHGPRPTIAVAGGRAFEAPYEENLELLRAAGCDIVTFDPLTDADLPEGTNGLVIVGWTPEKHAEELAANRPLLDAIAAAARAGLPIVAECGGYLLLAETLDGHRMAGVLPVEATTGERLHMGYRSALAATDTLLARVGEAVTAHEFHRTIADPRPGAGIAPAWRRETSRTTDGVSLTFQGDLPTVHAGYLHLHWATLPLAAQRFADAARAARPTARPDLDHHGDRDLGDGLTDFAVNVAGPRPPGWLTERILAGADGWAAYPDAHPARAALAELHGVGEDEVLPTAGAAEAFTLLARALTPTKAVVVHPQFTEPEAALLAAGHPVERAVLRKEEGFRLDAAVIPDDADLVMIGNPTNPTGVLHPAAAIEALRREGRVLVVDEAFLDVSGDEESLIRTPLDGVLVLRSLTKTFSLAGLRAGYVVGDAGLLARLEAQQPPWSVSTPAIDAMRACAGPEGKKLTRDLARELPARRADLVARLRELGLDVVESAAPFVLVETSAIDPTESIRPDLARHGVAVRRGETFPGLGPTWIRVAVRDEARHRQLEQALRALMNERNLLP